MRTTTDPKQAYIFFSFLRKTLGFYLKISFKTELLNANTVKPPFVLLANHPSSFDPFLIAAYLDHPINYVISDTWFRKPYLRFLLAQVGGIPKTKYLSDTNTVRALINAKKKNGIIGIFPEGARSWDGTTLPLIYSTAKLIKMLKINVVVCKSNGFMFSKPRWSKYKRQGKTYLSFEKILDPEDIKSMDTDAIFEKISSSVTYDDYAFQKQHMIKYKGKKLAEKLELFIYLCPSCKSFHTMHSKDDIFICENCGYTVTYNEYGFFEGKDVLFDDTQKWNEFQRTELKKMLDDDFSADVKKVLLSKGVNAFSKLKKIKLETVHISRDEFYFIDLKKIKFSFDIEKISGINIQANHILEFYVDDDLYSLDFAKSNISAYAAKNILMLSNDLGGENG